MKIYWGNFQLIFYKNKKFYWYSGFRFSKEKAAAGGFFWWGVVGFKCFYFEISAQKIKKALNMKSKKSG